MNVFIYQLGMVMGSCDSALGTGEDATPPSPVGSVSRHARVCLRVALTALAFAITSTALPATTDPVVWRRAADQPTARAEIGVTSLDGRIFVIGGTQQDGPTDLVWDSTLVTAYDPERDSWKKLAPLPLGLTHVGIAAAPGAIYVVGGFTAIIHEKAQLAVLEYDVASDAWRRLPDLPAPLGSVAAAVIGGKLHVLGGRGPDKRPVNSHSTYDFAARRWSVAAPLPGPGRDHMGIAVLNGEIHLFGGRTGELGDETARHDVYDPATGRWTTRAPLPRARSSGAATIAGGRIIYAGGECKPGGRPFTPNVFDDVTAWDAASDSWTALTPLPQPRHAFGAATIGDTAYFIGGAALCGAGSTRDVLRMTIGERR